MTTDDTLENLVREVYELAAVRRDMWRRAGFEQAQTIAALNAVRRLGPVRVSAVAEDLSRGHLGGQPPAGRARGARAGRSAPPIPATAARGCWP